MWSNEHKVAFLHTVLDGLPFPEIFISAGEVNPNTGDGTELIVDGQQRITTLYQYFTASRDLRLTPDVPPYANLPDKTKMSFLEYEVVVRDLGPLSEEETKEIFQRINSTRYSLNAMEVNNSRFDGELKKFAEEVAGDAFFESHRIFTGLDGRRMNDTRFVLTVIISILSGYFNRDDAHEEYLERYNDDFPLQAEIDDRLKRLMRFLDKCDFPRRSRIWQKADLLTALVELDQVLNVEKQHVDPSDVRQVLLDFYSEVEEVTRVSDPAADAGEYYRRVRSGINDRISRLKRGEAIRGRLQRA